MGVHGSLELTVPSAVSQRVVVAIACSSYAWRSLPVPMWSPAVWERNPLGEPQVITFAPQPHSRRIAIGEFDALSREGPSDVGEQPPR